MVRSLGRSILLLFLILAAIAAASTGEEEASDNDGRIVQSLFRFPASQLGPEFEQLLNLWYDEWLYTTNNENDKAIITPDPSGKQHALQSVSTPATTLFRRQCYGAAPIKSPQFTHLYNNLEQRRKEIEFQYIQDPKEEMTMLHTMVKRFYPAFSTVDNHSGTSAAAHLHKKKVVSTEDTIHAKTNLPLDYDSPSKLAFQTLKLSSPDTDDDDDVSPTQQWSWRPAGQFSNRGMSNFLQWRVKFYHSMRTKFQRQLSKETPGFKFSHGRPSGMYWYPPGAVREWHSNYLDLIGNTKEKKTGNEKIYASQTWRMYFIRTVRDDEFDGLLQNLGVGGSSTDFDDHSAMHIIPGEDEGITLDVLQKAGARPLTKEEKQRQWKDEFAEEYSNSTFAGEEVDSGEEGTLDRNSVWRLPDKNGYVTFFRLPKLFHCIVSEEVHRYSLGFAFSDDEVQALLKLAKVDFDVYGDSEGYTDEL